MSGRPKEVLPPTGSNAVDLHATARHDNARIEVKWLPAEHERILVTVVLERALRDVEQLLHIAPERLIQLAYGKAPGWNGLEISLLLSPAMAWLRVPVRVTTETPPGGHGTGIGLRWQASHFTKSFPTMAANLSVRPDGRGRSELVLEGRYQPPLGIVGLIGDHLFGRRVVEATVKGFVGQLASAIERGAGEPGS